jgi:hypothetical protein
MLRPVLLTPDSVHRKLGLSENSSIDISILSAILQLE